MRKRAATLVRMHRFRVPDGNAFRLAQVNPGDSGSIAPADRARVLAENQKRIAELQNRLYAEGERSLLVLLQSMDTGGKDPIIRDVLSAANPQACRVTAFKKVSGPEEKEDRFRRYHKAVPRRGEIGVFNRSYYDDVINRAAHGELAPREAAAEYTHINNFEHLLADDHVTIVKVFLHISKDEQRRRLQERMNDPARHWELSEADFRERKFWDGYMRAFEDAICRSNTNHAPWFLIPADDREFRDAAASVILREALEAMDPQFPPASIDLGKVELD